MPAIPRDTSPDSTLALLLDGYTFIDKRCRRYQSDIFETGLLLQRAICLHGAEAVRLFYETRRFRRKGAMPQRVLNTLLGQGGVQTLDGAPHRQRKHMFVNLLTGDYLPAMLRITHDEWHAAIDRWEQQGRVVLFDELQELLCRAACRWANVPLPAGDVRRRTRHLAALIESPVAIGPSHWRGLWARRQTEHWLGDIVDTIRTRQLLPVEGSAAAVIAAHRDVNGALLDRHTPAVELLNIVRPIVAVARFMVFAALALHQHPEHARRLREGDDAYAELFVQEVCRLTPFFPFIAAIVEQSFEWRGYRFPKGRWVILDLYGTNHDGRLWQSPQPSSRSGFATGITAPLISFHRAAATISPITAAPANI